MAVAVAVAVNFSVSTAVAAAFPDLTIAIVTLVGVDNRSRPAGLEDVRRGVVAEVASRLAETPLDDYAGVAAWRDAYRTFGTNPRKHRPSAEALLRRIAQRKELRAISPVVDVYLVSSIETGLPIGGYDLRSIEGDIVLDRARGGEPFVPLGGLKEENAEPGEVVYRDDVKVLTRRWNHRDGELAKIGPATVDAVLFCESPSAAIPPEDVREGGQRLAAYAERFCCQSTALRVVRAADGPVSIA